MAFVLLALVLVGFLVFLFWGKFQVAGVQESAARLKSEAAISMLEKVAGMSELKCAEVGLGLCVDEDKAAQFAKLLKSKDYARLVQATELKIINLYPAVSAGKEKISLIAGSANVSYSTFVNICKQDKDSYNCRLGMLVLGI